MRDKKYLVEYFCQPNDNGLANWLDAMFDDGWELVAFSDDRFIFKVIGGAILSTIEQAMNVGQLEDGSIKKFLENAVLTGAQCV